MRTLEIFAWLTALIILLTGAKARSTRLTPWEEDQPLGKAGGFYLTALAKNLNTNASSVSIDLYDDESRQIITFDHQIGKNQEELDEIWTLPPGLYRLVRIRYGDLSWMQWKNSKLVLIREGELSNLGKWILKPGKNDDLAIALRRTQTTYSFDEQEDSPFHAVIDGFAGKTQLVKRGQHAGRLSRVGPGGTYVASFSYYRHVALSYDIKVNNSQHAAPLLSRIDTDRSLFHQCYTDQMDVERSGKVQFKFAQDPKSQRLETLKLVHSDIKNDALENCLNNQLGGIHYDGSKDLKGTITFNFAVGQQTL
jgi:hypothetical protein